MKKLTAEQIFKVLIPFLKEEYKSKFDSWQLASVLGLLSSDSGALYTFDSLVKELPKKSSLDTTDLPKASLKLGEEQALIAIRLFLDSYYWEKNNDILLKDVINDIESLTSEKDFYKTDFWKQWLKTIKYASNFDFN